MKKYKTSAKKSHWLKWTIIWTLLLVIILGISFATIRISISHGVSTAKKEFSSSFENARTDTYSHFYDITFKASEAEHHVSNRVLFSISDIKAQKKLEVFQVYDTFYDISDSKDNITSWLKVTGRGTYTVNLDEAEYSIDNARSHVLVRIPKPELTADLDAGRMDKILFKQNKFIRSSSEKEGFELAMDQYAAAQDKLEANFISNLQYQEWAEESAIRMIKTLIKGFNPDVEDLQVDVEFYS